jgi:hypothetical protein
LIYTQEWPNATWEMEYQACLGLTIEKITVSNISFHIWALTRNHFITVVEVPHTEFIEDLFHYLYLNNPLLNFSRLKLFSKMQEKRYKKEIMICGVIFAETIFLLQIKPIIPWLGNKLFNHILPGCGIHHVSQSTNFTSGYFFMTDLTQGIF